MYKMIIDTICLLQELLIEQKNKNSGKFHLINKGVRKNCIVKLTH